MQSPSRLRPAPLKTTTAIDIHHSSSRTSTSTPFYLSIFILSLLVCQASAFSITFPRNILTPSLPATSTLVFDSTASAPVLDKRQDSGADGSISPFDSGFGATNMTSSCALFFKSFLQDPSMTSCQPISLLLMTSQSFFQASKSADSLQSVVSGSCKASQKTCSQKMYSWANQLKAGGNCGSDYQKENPYVLQAYDGFIAYDALYNATCMKSRTGDSCFVSAMTNAQAPDSSYIYYLPLGINLPTSAKPECNSCMQKTMESWQTAAANASTPLSASYNPAVTQMDGSCGAAFAKQAVQVPQKKNAAALLSPTPIWTLGLTAFASFYLL